ncbi:SDR family oxidoreductase [Ferrimonas marina]|uniref:Citronellol/citronellal dehydrogenase n=1 Tax=Ferrimonas marina TaxID=299255 RepID=A0A1M5P0A1_9GAMM|nr:NAD(P)-dependent oxidoreductase [Ferrimonas marina]SHG95137.1 citronellol/citronellal dehydrogenase [Ferrimonas marina]
MTSMKDTTLFITGASRGIGRAIALAAAEQGANVVIAAKSDTPHPKLEGTIHSVAEEVQAAGGQALAIKLDVRDEAAVEAAMAQAAAHFGGIDVLVNNASAINLSPLKQLPVKRFDLIHSINTRGSLVCSQAAIPYLSQSDNGHIITLSPPINLAPHWLGPHIPYTMSKYGMTLLTLGLAEELKADGISCTTLWPQTTIATAAIEYALDPALMACSRTPQIMADAAMAILSTTDGSLSGQCLVDEALLKQRGVTDFEQYRHVAGGPPLMRDLFLDQ